MKLASEPDAGGQPVARQQINPQLYRSAKRSFDLLFAVLLLPALLPVIGVFWALVRSDGSPGLYMQLRVGRDGRTFRCWKLRTMHVDAEERLKALCDGDPEVAREWEVMQKLTDDPRITKLGAFLRATSLDELPQIFNVLTGDMSFVGPRPFMTCQETLYRAAGGRAYYELRPGITGLWQVEGRGETSFCDRVTFDERYFQSLSLGTDARLVVRTSWVVLRKSGR